MIHLEEKYHWLESPQAYVSCHHEDDKMIVFERGSLLWVFNFHSTKSFADYRVGASIAGKYKIALQTDAAEFGGHSRLDPNCEYSVDSQPWHDRPFSVLVYVPCRTALVLAPV